VTRSHAWSPGGRRLVRRWLVQQDETWMRPDNWGGTLVVSPLATGARLPMYTQVKDRQAAGGLPNGQGYDGE
jgi:hypothetical protein